MSFREAIMTAPSAGAVDTLSTVSDLLASMARAGPMRPRSGSVTGPLRLKPELWTGAAVAVAVGTLSFSPAVTAEGQFSPAVTAEGQDRGFGVHVVTAGVRCGSANTITPVMSSSRMLLLLMLRVRGAPPR